MPPPQRPLLKQRSWSPDTHRDEAWLRRKGIMNSARALRDARGSKSVTDDDLDELRACIELGFGFDSPEVDPKLSDTLPALGLLYAVNRSYHDVVCKSPASASSPAHSTVSDSDTPSPVGSPLAIVGSGEDPEMVKTKLKQWAQVVACSVRHSYC